MTPLEEAAVFGCDGEQLVGLLTQPEKPATLGVLIVVGGPQYRIGSHRQFVQLARFLADHGYASFRFDYRGMGDSSGAMRSFDSVGQDVLTAVATFKERHPTIQRLVLFGLCDGASAVLMAATNLTGVHGLILANPWVRQDDSLNEAVLRHYYGQRLLSREFWAKLATGRLPLLKVAGEFIARLRKFVGLDKKDARKVSNGFIEQMLLGWRLPVRKLLLLSGQDLTAREFDTLRANDPRWNLDPAAGLLAESAFHDADHTFSSRKWRDAMHARCLAFLAGLS